MRLLAAALLLAACNDGPQRLAPINLGPPPPPGTPRITEPVDGLVVGHRLMAAGEYELALSAYSRAARDYGATADVLSAIGSANLRLGRINAALRWLSLAVEEDPDFAPAWNNLGVAHLIDGNVPGARAAFRAAVAVDSGETDEIRANLSRAEDLFDDLNADTLSVGEFSLVRRGNGRYLLLQTPE